MSKSVVTNWTGGPKMWSELHQRAIQWNGANDMTYLVIFGHRLPKFQAGCKCSAFYNIYLKEFPPQFSNYFEWTVNLHNAVNKKLNKPEISLEDARKIWSK